MLEQEVNIIEKFSDYVQAKWSIDLIKEPSEAKVKKALNLISNDNLPIIRLEEKIAKKRQDYEDISKPYVRGETFGSYGGGSPVESYKVSYDENIHILRMELEQEISDMAIHKAILEKQLKEEFDLFDSVLILLPNQMQRQVFIMNYIEKKRNADIAIILNFAYNTVCQYMYNGIREITKKIKQYSKI